MTGDDLLQMINKVHITVLYYEFSLRILLNIKLTTHTFYKIR